MDYLLTVSDLRYTPFGLRNKDTTIIPAPRLQRGVHGKLFVTILKTIVNTSDLFQ